MSRAAIIGGLVVVAMGPVAAKPPPLDYDETERVEPWSWVPLLSALAAFDSEAPDQTGGVFGAQLRIRHGTAFGIELDLIRSLASLRKWKLL